MTAAEREFVRELVRREVNAAVADACRMRNDELAELRDELHTAVTELHHRITAVHERALRELTRLHERKQPA